MKKLILLLFCLFLASSQFIRAQQSVITGRLTNGMSGEPLPGVTVQVKGSTVSVLSQVNGTYSITVASGEAILVYSFEGYQSREIAVAGRTVIDVSLTEQLKALEESSRRVIQVKEGGI